MTGNNVSPADAVPQAPAVRITDSTLRDGSHAVSHRFTDQQVRSVVRALEGAGVPVIEVTHGHGLGGSSFAYGLSLVEDITLIAAAADEATLAKIAVLMLPGLGTSADLARAFDAGATVARIAAHCTEADLSSSICGPPGTSACRPPEWGYDTAGTGRMRTLLHERPRFPGS